MAATFLEHTYNFACHDKQKIIAIFNFLRLRTLSVADFSFLSLIHLAKSCNVKYVIPIYRRMTWYRPADVIDYFHILFLSLFHLICPMIIMGSPWKIMLSLQKKEKQWPKNRQKKKMMIENVFLYAKWYIYGIIYDCRLFSLWQL